MDMNLVLAAVGAQGGSVQAQIATVIARQNVQTAQDNVVPLPGAAQQPARSLTNVGPGIGGKLDVSA